MGIGDWGLGFWGWGVWGGGAHPQTNKQTPKEQKPQPKHKKLNLNK